MKQIFNTQPLNNDLASLLLRLTFGGLFVYFGYNKLVNYDQYLPMFGDIIGIGSRLSFNLVIFAEFFCGIFVVLGFVTRLSVIPIFITMTVAFFIAHAKDPFDAKALAFTLWCLSALVFILGSGKYSLDRILLTRLGIEGK
jgi:putative oxidoreductase